MTHGIRNRPMVRETRAIVAQTRMVTMDRMGMLLATLVVFGAYACAYSNVAQTIDHLTFTLSHLI